MPVTHGSTSGSTDATVPFVSNIPTLDELATAKPREGSPLSHALHRAAIERRNPRRVPAGFDNRLC